MKQVIKTILVCIALVATQISFAQTANPVSIAAPNLPEMVRFDNTGEAFNGENHQYKSTENIASLNEWATRFPTEVITYKAAIELYLATDSATLSGTDKETYEDLKSQWIMFSQL